MKYRRIKQNILFLFVFLAGIVGADVLLQVEQPLSVEESSHFLQSGYRIAGKKIVYVDQSEESLLINGRIPLYDQHGKKCYACQKLNLPLKSPQFPLFWDEEGDMTHIRYGPYSFSVFQINKRTLYKLEEVAQCFSPQEVSDFRPSQVAKQMECHCLTHSTRPENLISIINSGELNPSRGKTGRLRGDLFGNDQYVFCSLLIGKPETKTFLSLTGNGLPILVFDVEPILDNNSWHANAGHPFGAFSQFKTSDGRLCYSAHYQDKERFVKLLKNPQTIKRNEIVFHLPVKLNDLKMILVKKGTKNELMERIGDERYREILVEVDPLYANSFTFPKWLKPYSMNSHDKVRYGLENPGLDLPGFRSLVKNEYPQLVELVESNKFSENISKLQWLSILLEHYWLNSELFH